MSGDPVRHHAVVGAALLGVVIEKGWLKTDSVKFDVLKLKAHLSGEGGIQLDRPTSVRCALGMVDRLGGIGGETGDRGALAALAGDAYDELVEEIGRA